MQIKNKVVAILVTSLVLSGCTKPTVSTTTTDQTKQAEKIASIMARGGQAKCTVSEIANPENVTSMVISGKKMRFSGANVSNDKKTIGNFINDGNYTYIWQEGEKEGIKMKNLTEEELAKMAESAKSKAEEYKSDKYVSEYEDEAKYKMDCKEGSVADSEFVPPADIEFTDMSAMMDKMKQAMPSYAMPSNMPSYPGQ